MNQPKRMPAYLFGTDIPDPRGREPDHKPVYRPNRMAMVLGVLTWCAVLVAAVILVLLFR